MLCKGNRLSEYQFIESNKTKFGVSWLCQRLNISTSCFYNYLKQRKQVYYEQKALIQRLIAKAHHQSNGTMGAKMMRDYCKNNGITRCLSTIRKYMKELHFSSSVRHRKKYQRYTKEGKTFPNLIERRFHAPTKHQVWCMDFTYLHLKNGSFYYNCTIVDLYNRAVVASKNSENIDTRLATNMLQQSIVDHQQESDLILHTDQGS